MSAPPDTVAPRLGYQPSLDGLRAVSVIAVLFYHAGFSWMHGGFFGVEVFFVVSGFLITSLLLDEQERSGGVSFRGFWQRRARRLFPALGAVLVAVMVWTALAGTAEQVSQVRRDVPWAVFYVSNWGQILGDVPYFSGEPPLLRHLWSLGVEEQWYVIWPLVFVGLMVTRLRRPTVAVIIIGTAVAVMGYTAWLESRAPTPLGAPPALFEGVNRTNFMYLSTITRVSGLLLGAGAAFFWRPWRWRGAATARVGRLLDPLGAAALAALGCAFAVAVITEGYVYRWLLPLVSTLSLVTVMIGVHPAAAGFRSMVSWRPLVEVGKRSYGLYLWSWPIFVVFGATDGSFTPFLAAMVVTVVVTEVSYRFLETPVRQGALGRWWKDRATITLAPVAGGVILLGSLAAFYVSVDDYDRFEGGDEVVFDAAAVAAAEVDSTEGAPQADPDPSPATTVAAPVESTTTEPEDPGPRLAIVGDSQANALAVNLPRGIEELFPDVVNGSLDGCSVWDSGGVRSAVTFSNTFAICEGWQENWAESAADSDVTLVVIGAWDVFDVEDGDVVYLFDTPLGDQQFAANLQSGIDAILDEGSSVALLEIACMRPVDVADAGVRALPERGDDDRITHLNDVMRWVSSQYGPEVEVVDGPDEWCNDEQIATDLSYRWDGVHVYQPGANLIMENVADDLLRLADA